ncbi:MAG: hypothetical protein ACE5FA_00685 [Dehalococcoidia bacterium]
MPLDLSGGHKSVEIDLLAPTGAYGRTLESVSAPNLIEVAGVDGRFPGSLRTYPGLRGCLINGRDGQVGPELGVQFEGPVIMGPGVDHDPAVLRWKIRCRSSNDVLFFREMSFRKAKGDARVVHGFVVVLPYTGPFWDGVTATNKGLPRFFTGISGTATSASANLIDSGNPFVPLLGKEGRRVVNKTDGSFGVMTKYVGIDELETTLEGGTANTWGLGDSYVVEIDRRVAAFVYWDDEPRTFVGGSVDEGWRVRILNNTEVGGAEKSVGASVTNLDTSFWAEYGYVVWAQMLATGAQEWGGPDRLASEDSASGPAVIYWDTTNNYPAVRSMGQQLTSVTEPTAQTDVVSLPKWEDNTPASGTDGRILNVAANANFNVAFSFYDSGNGVRSALFHDTTMTAIADQKGWVYGEFNFHTDTWNLYDHLELWRSFPGNPGVFYREKLVALPSLPGHDAAKDHGGTSWRTFVLTWGGDVVASMITRLTAVFTLAANYRNDFVVQGLTNWGVLLQLPYDGVWDFVQEPPADTSRVVVNDDVSFIIGDRADVLAADFVDTQLVPPRLRWSSLVVPKPENFSDLANLWFPDRKAGDIYELVRVGESVLVLGTLGIMAIRPSGDRLVIGEIGRGLAVIGREAWDVGGSTLFALTSKGLMAIDTAQNQVRPFASLNSMLLGSRLTDWSRRMAEMAGGRHSFVEETNLSGSLSGMEISVAYDEVSDAVYVSDPYAGDAFVVWLSTGGVTRLYGLNFKFAKSCSVPEVVHVRGVEELSENNLVVSKRGRRACFFGEVYGGTNVVGADKGYRMLDVYHPDIHGYLGYPFIRGGPTTFPPSGGPSMHGRPSSSGSTVDQFMVGTIAAITSTTMDFAHSASISAGELAAINATMSGAMLVMVGADGTSKLFAYVDGFSNPSGNTLRITFSTITDLFTEDTSTATYNGGTFMLAPIITHVMTGFLSGLGSGGGWFTRESLLGVELVMGLLFSKDFSAGGQSDPWSKSIVNVTSFRPPELQTSDANHDDFFNLPVRMGTAARRVIMGNASKKSGASGHGSLPFAMHRLEQLDVKAVTPDLRLGQMAAGLQGSARKLGVGIELYSVLCQLDLRALKAVIQVSGN